MNLTELSSYASRRDPQLIPRIKRFLDRSDIQATKGAQRLILVCENFKLLTFEQAYHLINADAFQDEYEEMQSYKPLISFLNYLRIALSLVPLIFTWFALFSATSSYQNDLKKNPGDETTAFLQLWQSGFNHTTFWTFSTTAIIDVILLASLLATSLVILLLERNARHSARRFAGDLREVTEGLLKAVNVEGVSQSFGDADIDKLVKALRVALDGAFAGIDATVKRVEQTVQNANTAINNANTKVEQLFTQQVNPLLSRFDRNVQIFQTNIDTLTKAVNTLNASTATIATSSSSMANSANQMATSAAGLDAKIVQMNTHLTALNDTEKKIEIAQRAAAAEVSKAAASMNAASGTVTGAAGKMDQAAQKVEHVGNTLATIDPQMVRQISYDTAQVAQKAKETAMELQDTINALKNLKRRKIFGIF